MNLFELPRCGSETESFETLISTAGTRVERIVSQGQASPEGFWYDQPQAEWVVVLKGSARLRFQDAPDAVELTCGDSVNIPARRRHRVEWTAPDETTIWLAVHYSE